MLKMMHYEEHLGKVRRTWSKLSTLVINLAVVVINCRVVLDWEYLRDWPSCEIVYRYPGGLHFKGPPAIYSWTIGKQYYDLCIIKAGGVVRRLSIINNL